MCFTDALAGIKWQFFVCSSHLRNREVRRGWRLHLATQDCIALATLEGLGGPLGAQSILPKPILAGEYPDTWFSLLESCAWRCGSRIHACYWCVAQEVAFHSLLLYIYCLYHINCIVSTPFEPQLNLFLGLKTNHHEIKSDIQRKGGQIIITTSFLSLGKDQNYSMLCKLEQWEWDAGRGVRVTCAVSSTKIVSWKRTFSRQFQFQWNKTSLNFRFSQIWKKAFSLQL